MLLLLRNCVDEVHSESWGDFWILMEDAASRPVRHLLQRFGVDAQDAEDRVQDIFLLLQKNDMQKLRSFRGSSLDELAAWLKRIAINHTLNWLEKHSHRLQLEKSTLPEHYDTDLSRYSDKQLFELLDDLKANLTNREIEKLEILAGMKIPPRPVPERTLRRWRRQLRNKYEAS